ncbi:MAG: hypothetical protein JW951_09215, partial [Lentisphaerae bacterium]|nr:hypothetical protein [Lentisphaerota bacterium]
ARENIDAWPIAEAGLPARVTRRMPPAGQRTVGDLRRLSDNELASIRGLGARSVNAVRAFFRECGALETGTRRFADADALLRHFLNTGQWNALALRYGLQAAEDARLSRRHATLQTIGTRRRITRERARQLENEARAILGCRLAQACLEPLYERFETALRAAGGALDAAGAAAALPRDDLDAYRPDAFLLLLCDCRGRPVYRNGLFTLLSHDQLDRLETAAARLLDSRPTPQPFAVLHEALRPETRSLTESGLRVVLAHLDRVAVTTGGGYVCMPGGSALLLRNLLGQHDRPVHFRALTAEYNALMRPGSRKGSGFVLGILNADPDIERFADGTYRLRQDPGRPARLPPPDAPEASP